MRKFFRVFLSMLAFVSAVSVAVAASGQRSVSFFSAKMAQSNPTAGDLWTPLNDPNLVAWWDASDTANMTFNGSNVISWTDRKGGLVASQAIDGKRPVYSATALNGKPGVTFTGANFQELTFTPSASFPSGSSAYMQAIASQGVADTYKYQFSFGSNASAQLSALGLNGSSNARWYNGTGTIDSAASWNTNRFVELTAAAGASPVVFIYSDGTQVATATSVTLNLTQAGGAIGSMIGVNFATATVQQVIVSSAVPSTSVRQKYEGWESWTDGKAGANLPSGHPYKSRAPLVSDP